MTVKELIDLLETYDPTAEVRLGTQESYPFQNSLVGVVSADEINAGAEPEEYDDEDPTAVEDHRVGDFDGIVDGPTVFLLEGRQLGYFNREAWDRARNY